MAKLLLIICCLFRTFLIYNDAHGVLALATPGRSSRKRPPKRSRSSVGGGFAKGFATKKKKDAASVTENNSRKDSKSHEADIDNVSKVAVSKLFSVCSHIQNPQLYQPKWANSCQLESRAGNAPRAIATRNVKKGQVLTLFPIHALGLRNLHADNGNEEFVAYDHEKDGDLFKRESQRATKLNIQLDVEEPAHSVLGNKKDIGLFALCLPQKEVLPGWLGGVIKATSSAAVEESNCVTLPLPGAAPLCAVVATKDIKEGDEVVHEVQMQPLEQNALDELKSTLAKDYRREISTLRLHVEMACEMARSLAPETAEEVEPLGPFHQINLRYPNLQQIHKDPDIFAIEKFLTENECDGIIAKARPHLQPCVVYKQEGGEKAERDSWRTNTNANLPQAEVPTVVQKITELACCSVEQLEILQVLHYEKGQQFKPHTDGFSGPYSACGFEQSTRLATVFCYLNDVLEGGSTYFPEIDLDIQPRRGTAVIHFPADENMREDTRTLHQGKPAIDDKWLLTTWVWKTERTDEAFAESKLPRLSNVII